MNKPDKTAQRLLGFKDPTGRQFADFYPTPELATTELIKREVFNGVTWECACGDGAISKVLIKNGIEVVSSDILDYGYGKPGVDFLNDSDIFTNFHFIADNIITNPPFNVATEFVRMAKRWSSHKIAMFLKTTFLEGVDRYDLFQDRSYPLKTVYQFSRRVSFGNSKNGGMLSFAWFVWDKQYTGDPQINWII